MENEQSHNQETILNNPDQTMGEPLPSSSSDPKVSTNSSDSSQENCAICLNSMKAGQGLAMFTAECSHTFHFQCIASNVKHGNRICPICREIWKVVPLESPNFNQSQTRSQFIPSNFLPPSQLVDNTRNLAWNFPSLYPFPDHTTQTRSSEPLVFNDDEAIPDRNSPIVTDPSSSTDLIKVQTFAEISAVEKSSSHDNFTVLVHLQAPAQSQISSINEHSKAPVDLVTVLDVSGSMSGSKLALLKQAMGFVIEKLGPSDRLSVISFSSQAHRVLPLCLMTESGKHRALQAVNGLNANGGTNIAEGLKKGAKVLTESQYKNPVFSIILLSDGQDTYISNRQWGQELDYRSLLPSSDNGFRIPVHTFGFGADHDADAMHAISVMSGGTFSFIETVNTIQDAFAQCIGGLLSVVAQNVNLEIVTVHPTLQLKSIKGGNYQTRISTDARFGFIDIGDLYAEEERDFLITIDIPKDNSNDEISLVKVNCTYINPISKENVIIKDTAELTIQRPETVVDPVVSIEVDRQRNRIRASEAMAEARVAAENGDLRNAVSIHENCIRTLTGSVSMQSGDLLSASLCADLRQMNERMGNANVYGKSGRAYMLSGMSSHAQQRASTRGDSTSSALAYQTSVMFGMVAQSQSKNIVNPFVAKPSSPDEPPPSS